MGWMKDESGLEKRSANYTPLTPLSFLTRAAHIWPECTAIVDRDYRATYAEHIERCTRMASALTKLGVESGDVVATLLPNVAPQAEAHFGVPACGAVLNTINTRLDVTTVA